jgi:hypothetical protein
MVRLALSAGSPKSREKSGFAAMLKNCAETARLGLWTMRGR